MDTLIPIALFHNWTVAEVYRSHLLAEGILAVIDHPAMHSLMGSAVITPGGIPLKIRDDQAILALRILERLKAESGDEAPFELLY